MHPDVFISFLNHFQLSRGENLKLELQLPEREHGDFSTDLKSIRRQPGGLIWGAGGGSYLIDRAWLPMVKRSSDAPTNPNRWTIATGLAGSYAQLRDPRLFIRELFEEIVLVDNAENLILPVLTGSSAWLNEHIPAWVPGLSSRRREIQAHLLEQLARDEVTVITSEGRHTAKVMLYLNEAQCAVNLLWAVAIDGLGLVPGKDLRAIDTERDTNGKLLHRETGWYHLLTGKLDGRPLPAEELTPHANYLLQALRREI